VSSYRKQTLDREFIHESKLLAESLYKNLNSRLRVLVIKVGQSLERENVKLSSERFFNLG